MSSSLRHIIEVFRLETVTSEDPWMVPVQVIHGRWLVTLELRGVKQWRKTAYFPENRGASYNTLTEIDNDIGQIWLTYNAFY